MIQKPGPGIAPEVAAGSCAWRRRRCAVVLQTGRDYRVGNRLPLTGSRSAPLRAVERQGALRPAVAAAMVHLAGPPRGPAT